MRQPPEKLATGSPCRAAGEAEAREQRRGARARAVAADDVEAMMQLGERAPCAAASRRPDRRSSAASAALDLAQLRSPSST